MVGSINQGKYLRVADADGNIEIADVTVTTDFLAEWPLASETLTDGSRTTYEIATTGTTGSAHSNSQGGITIPIAAAGISLHWNGGAWIQGKYHRFSQPPASSPKAFYASSGVALGPDATFLQVPNQHTIGGRPIVALDSDGNMSNENWSASAQETLIQMKARTIGILDAEFTTDFDKATGGPAATIDNTISVILNERVTSENQKNLIWRVEISWTALIQDQSTATDIDGASGKYCLGVLSTYNGGVRSNSEFDSGTDAWQVESSLGASPWGQNPIQAQIINDGGTDRLQIQCMGLSIKNIMWSAHVGVYNNICHKALCRWKWYLGLIERILNGNRNGRQ